MSEGTCHFELVREERDFASGYMEPVRRTYNVSVSEAENIIATLMRQIPLVKEENRKSRQVEIDRLKARLKELGDC